MGGATLFSVNILGSLGLLPSPSELQAIPVLNTGGSQSSNSTSAGGSPPGNRSDLSNVLAQLRGDSLAGEQDTGKKMSGGVYVGAGLSPVSSKLAQRIRQWEFIDMAELLPEVQLFGGAEDGRPGGKRITVTDILTWVQCFGIYVSVLAPSYPEAVPELLAYMLEIVGQAKRFRGKTWVLYDATFRRQAAASGNRRWSEVNGTLHASCYSGEAPSGLGCELCMSASHTTRECSLRGADDGLNRGPTQAVQNRPAWRQPTPSGEVCRSWNENRCRCMLCRHTHVCSRCGGNHPATVCQWPPVKPMGPPGFKGRGNGQGWPPA